MSAKTSIALVKYLNTLPFVHGLSLGKDSFDLHLLIPADCYKAYSSQKVDIALLPVGTLPLLEDYTIITDTCIGCDGEVRTVCLFSHSPIDQVSAIYLDNHSRTSVLLTRVLMQEYYGHDISFVQADVSTIERENLAPHEAILMIGDKVFDAESHFKYKIDLGALWKQHTGLPFVFAVWVARKSVSNSIVNELQESLHHGLSNIDESIAEEINKNVISNIDTYIKENIDYRFDGQKRKALTLFLSKISELPNPSF